MKNIPFSYFCFLMKIISSIWKDVSMAYHSSYTLKPLAQKTVNYRTTWYIIKHDG